MKFAVVLMCVLSVILMYLLMTEESRRYERVIGATAVCNDGYVTTSPRGRGVCSGHGGVKKWLD